MAVVEGHLAHLTYECPQTNEWQLFGSGDYLQMTLASVFKMAFAMKKAVLATALDDIFGVAMTILEAGEERRG